MPPKKKITAVEWELRSKAEGDKKEATKRIPLHLGTQVLGRASLPDKDLKVSRQHCQITLLDGVVWLARIGHNPIHILRQGEKVVINQGSEFKLKEGDTVCFLPDEHHFVLTLVKTAKVRAKRKRESTGDPVVEKKPRHDTEKKLTKEEEEKRKQQEEEDMKIALSLQPKECTLCLEDTDVDFLQSLSCSHEFCRECLAEYFKTAIESKDFPLTCPAADCRKDVSDSDLQLLLPPGLLTKYEKFLLSDFVDRHSSDYSCCPSPNCSYLFFFTPGECDFKCPKCQKRYCLNCKVEYHTGSTCKQYEQWSIDNGLGDIKFTAFVKGRNFKQCPACKKWVERNGGCRHISCRCGEEFCYVCGGNWPCENRDCDANDGDDGEDDNDSEDYY